MLPLRWSALSRSRLPKLLSGYRSHRSVPSTLKGPRVTSKSDSRPSPPPLLIKPPEGTIPLSTYQSPFFRTPASDPASLTPDPIANAATAFHPHVIRAYRDFKSMRSNRSVQNDPLIERIYQSTQHVLIYMNPRMHKLHICSRYLQNYSTQVRMLLPIYSSLNLHDNNLNYRACDVRVSSMIL